MSLITRAQAAVRAFRQKDGGAAALPAQGYLPTLGATPSSTGLLISQGTALTVSTVYACITIRSQDVARCRPRLFRRNAKGERQEVFDHPFLDLVRRPNQVQTWFEFMEQMNAAYLMRGNAYAALLRAGGTKIRELIPVNPDAVLVLEGWNGGVFYNVNRIGLWQLAMLAEFGPTLAADEILHLRGLTLNALAAISTIGMARDAIGLAMGLEQQAARWMQNGARPSMFLLSEKQITPTNAERLGRQFRDLYGGLANTGSIPVLEDGLKAQALQLTGVDVEFMAQRAFQPSDIARFYRMPPHKLGLEQMRGVNLVQLDQDYVSNTVMPDLHRWEQKFDQVFGLSEQGLEIKMDETVLLRADIQTRYNAARIGLLSGFLSPNEVRAGEGLGPVEGGDEVFRPLNMAALGSDMTGTAPDGAGRPASGELPADSTSGAAPADDDEKQAIEALTRAIAKRVVEIKHRALGKVVPDDAEEFLKKTLLGETRQRPSDEVESENAA